MTEQLIKTSIIKSVTLGDKLCKFRIYKFSNSIIIDAMILTDIRPMDNFVIVKKFKDKFLIFNRIGLKNDTLLKIFYQTFNHYSDNDTDKI